MKICLVFLSIVILGGFFLKVITNYVYEGIHLAFEITPKNDTFVLPNDYFKYTRPFSAEMKDKINANSNLNSALKNKGNIPWDKKATKHQIYIESNQTPAHNPNFLERLKIQGN